MLYGGRLETSVQETILVKNNHVKITFVMQCLDIHNDSVYFP